MTRFALVLFFLSAAAQATAQIPAFPGAEGFGAHAEGGRGGDVFTVTDLSDYDPDTGPVIAGTLRDGLESASGPRTIVFATGGTIELVATLEVHEDYLTIAGQTAPGDGIAIRTSPDHVFANVLLIRASHVIVRHLRIRPGPTTSPLESQRWAINIQSPKDIELADERTTDVILDHVSVSWGFDDSVVVTRDATNVTIQNSIIAESLIDPYHTDPPGGNSQGIIIYGKANALALDMDVSIHHNLFAHTWKRTPKITGSAGTYEVINNVVFDYRKDFYSTRIDEAVDKSGALVGDGFTRVSILGNHYIASDPAPWGLYQGNTIAEIFLMGNPIYNLVTDPLKIWMSGNYSPQKPAGVQQDLVWVPSATTYGAHVTEDEATYLGYGHVSAPVVPVTVDPHADALDYVLADAGAMLPARDSVDAAVVANATAGTHGWKYDCGASGPPPSCGWPTLAAGTGYLDEDVAGGVVVGDGMSDVWEDAWGFDKTDPTDRNEDADGDGYTNLEEFLNGTRPTPSSCGLGFELVLLLLPWAWFRLRTRSAQVPA